MYRNLEAEIARKGITKTYIASKLGITLGTLSTKLHGNSIITLQEAIKIKRILGAEIPLEDLFTEEKGESKEKQVG